MDEATKKEHQKEPCVNECCLLSQCCTVVCCKVKNKCECLLLLPEVWVAESKLCQVETSIKRVLDTGKADGQMKALPTKTLATVKEACQCNRV